MVSFTSDNGSYNPNRFFRCLGFANIYPRLVRKELPGKKIYKNLVFSSQVTAIIIVDNFRAMIINCSFFLQVTIYIAEFWNTITNLSMIVPALYGLSNVLKQGLERRWVPDMNTNIK